MFMYVIHKAKRSEELAASFGDVVGVGLAGVVIILTDKMIRLGLGQCTISRQISRSEYSAMSLVSTKFSLAAS